jgi:hypothetical protein
MNVTNINLGRSEQSVANVLNFLNINYPGFKFLKENQYDIYRNNVRYNQDEPAIEGKTVRIDLMDEGISFNVPIEAIKKPSVSVIPVFIDESNAINLECVFEQHKGKKIDYASNSQKVHSFENFEIRNGKVVPRSGRQLMNGDNIIIIRA